MAPADFAGVDAVTFQMARNAAAMDHLKVIDRTAPTPGLPYITALDNDPDQIFEAVSRAIGDLDDALRTALKLCPLQKIEAGTYLGVPTPPSPRDF